MRTTLVRALTAALVAALSAAGTPAAAPAAAPAAPTAAPTAASTVAAAKVKLRTTTPTVDVGDRARLVGRARAPRGTKVLVQRRTEGARKYVAAGRTRVRAAGRLRFSERVTSSRDRRYRACVTVRGNRSCSRAVGVDVEVARATVTLVVASTTPTTLEAGQAVTVSGTTSSALVGGTVHLQASYGGAWTTVGTVSVGADSRFAVSGVLAAPGRTVPLRVVAPETATTHEATAAAGAVTVFGWYYLHDAGPLVEVAGDWCPASKAVAGVMYPRSVAFGYNCKDDNVGEASVAAACTTFAATVGLSDSPDDTTADARYSFTLLTDGVVAHHIPAVAPGQAFEVSVPLAGVHRLRLEGPFVSGAKGLLVIGDARARCAF